MEDAGSRRGGTATTPSVYEDIPLTLRRDHFKKSVMAESYPELEEELEDFLDRCTEVARPKALYREMFVESVEKEEVRIGGAHFSSYILAEKLGNVPRVFPYACTCGTELDDLDISSYDPMLSELWLSTVKMQALGSAANFLKDLIKKKYDIRVLSSINPGSGNVDVWPVDQQHPLFSLLGDTKSSIGVDLTESALMVPDKSISGIYFPSQIEYCNCQSCTRENCPARRAPYEGPSSPVLH
jgi:hypothetical protein